MTFRDNVACTPVTCQAINNLALVDDNVKKIVDAGAVQYYTKLLSPDYDESVHKAAAHGLLMLAFVCKDHVVNEHGCLDGCYFSPVNTDCLISTLNYKLYICLIQAAWPIKHTYVK